MFGNMLHPPTPERPEQGNRRVSRGARAERESSDDSPRAVGLSWLLDGTSQHFPSRHGQLLMNGMNQAGSDSLLFALQTQADDAPGHDLEGSE